jgi:MFS family permease
MVNQMGHALRDIGNRVFGGYAELLRMPHTARFAIGSVIASMPFPMVGMTITISVQHYYGSYALAGALTAVQAVALAIVGPLLGKLVDKFGQRQVSIPTVIVWIIASTALISCITAKAPEWVLYCITPFLAAIPPWGAMSRGRWTHLLKGDRIRTDRALSLSGVFDECMWVIGNPLASILAVISGLLAFSFTGVCVIVGALMMLTELSTEPPSQSRLARESGLTRKEYRAREAAKAAEIQGEVGKQSIWGPGLVAVCVTWFGLGAFQSAAAISIVAFAREQQHGAVHGFRLRMLLVEFAPRRDHVWGEELDHPAVETLLLLFAGGQSGHWYLPVCQAPVGNHDHLPHHRRLPGTDLDQRQPTYPASGPANQIHRRRCLDGCDERHRRIGGVGRGGAVH